MQKDDDVIIIPRGSGTCRSCKHRYDDGHFSFPDCWSGHREENRKEGRGCRFYEFDASIL